MGTISTARALQRSRLVLDECTVHMCNAENVILNCLCNLVGLSKEVLRPLYYAQHWMYVTVLGSNIQNTLCKFAIP